MSKILGTKDAVDKLMRGFEVRPVGQTHTFYSLDYKNGWIVNNMGERLPWGIFDIAKEWEVYEEEEMFGPEAKEET